MDNVKKAIMYRWFYAIFVAKTIPKEDFTGKKALEVLREANFTIPYNKEFEAYLKELTAEFRAAVKDKRVAELLEQYPLPKFVERGSDDDEKEDVDEPTAEEVKTNVFNFLRGVDTETTSLKDVLSHLKEKYEMSFKHRKSEIKHYVEDFVNSQKISAQADVEESEHVEVPKVTGAKGAEAGKAGKPKKAKAKKDENSEETKMLREEYWKINSQVQSIKEQIALERGKLVEEDGSINSQVDAKIKELKGEEKVLLGRLKEIEAFVPKEKGPVLEIISRPVLSTTEATKNNLKYIAFLTYYVISPIINVEDPELEYTFKNYPDIPTKFKNDFLNLTVKDRYKFASSIISRRKFKTIAELIKKGEPLNMSDKGDIYVDVSLTNFIKEAEERNVDDEIKYNLMKYVSPSDGFSVMI